MSLILLLRRSVCVCVFVFVCVNLFYGYGRKVHTNLENVSKVEMANLFRQELYGELAVQKLTRFGLLL